MYTYAFVRWLLRNSKTFDEGIGKGALIAILLIIWPVTLCLLLLDMVWLAHVKLRESKRRKIAEQRLRAEAHARGLQMKSDLERRNQENEAIRLSKRPVRLAEMRRELIALVVANHRVLKNTECVPSNAAAINKVVDAWETNFQIDIEKIFSLCVANIKMQVALNKVAIFYDKVRPVVAPIISRADLDKLLWEITSRYREHKISVEEGVEQCDRIEEMVAQAARDAFPDWEASQEKTHLDQLDDALSDSDPADQQQHSEEEDSQPDIRPMRVSDTPSREAKAQ